MNPPTAKRIMAMSSNSCHVTVRLTSEVMSRVSYEDVARRFVRVPSKAWRRWRRRDIPNSQRVIAMAEEMRVSPGGGAGITLTATHPGAQGDRI